MDNTWNSALSRILKRLVRPDRETRTAVIGVGQALNGDDGAGLAVARLLRARVSTFARQSHSNSPSASHRDASQPQDPLARPSPAEELALHPLPVLVLQAGSTPENSTSLLRRFRPDLVLLVDAAEMGKPPGEVSVFEGEELAGFGGSTHTFSLALLVQYLELELGCQVAFLGIQPADTSFTSIPVTGPDPADSLPDSGRRPHETPLHLSPPVRSSCERVTRVLLQLLALD